jgi:hypothetical protein
MEQQNHELLGLIVAAQRAVCDELRAKEKKKDDLVARAHAGFMDTCIPGVWTSAKDILVQHYDSEFDEMEIPVSKCGRFVRRDDVIVGVRVWSRSMHCVSMWKCKTDKEGKLIYVASNVLRTNRSNMLGDYADLTKMEFEQTFLLHMAGLIPNSMLKDIEPVPLTAARPSKRRVVAMAE